MSYAQSRDKNISHSNMDRLVHEHEADFFLLDSGIKILFRECIHSLPDLATSGRFYDTRYYHNLTI